MLRRSQRAPLDISLRYYALRKRIASLEEKQRKTEIEVFENLDRIKVFNINMDYVSLTNLQSFLHEGLIVRHNASSLEDLAITSTLEDPLRHPFILKSTTFQNTDRLRKLRLVESQIDWKSPLLNNLTSFTYRLTAMAPEGSQPPRWQEIADAMAQMPELDTLHLKMPLPTEILSTPRIKSVKLNHLRSLTLDLEFPSQIRSFLSLTTVGPSLEKVFIRSANYDDIQESYANTLCALFDALPLSFWENLCSMRLGTNWSSKGTDLDILDFFRTAPPAKETVHGPVRLELPCKKTVQSGLEDHKILDIINSIDLSNLTTVTLLRVNLSAKALTTCLGHLPHLSSITVTGSTSLSLIEALTLDSTTVAAIPVHFANLLTITIQDTILQRDDSSKDITQIRDNFERSILQRQERGAVLKNLQVLECCSTLSKTLQHIEGINVDIDWDRMVEHYFEGSDIDEDDEEEEDGQRQDSEKAQEAQADNE